MSKTCEKYGHLRNSLYPTSQYKRDACGIIHPTRTCYGAVNWQCPRELILGVNYHKPAHQTWIGEKCVRCDQLHSPNEIKEMMQAHEREKAANNLIWQKKTA